MPRRKRNRRKNSASKRVVYVALIGNLGVTATKFIAAAISGSAGDAERRLCIRWSTPANELLLLYGVAQGEGGGRTPDHPLGHGRELYFWSFIVAILISLRLAQVFLLNQGAIRQPSHVATT